MTTVNDVNANHAQEYFITNNNYERYASISFLV